jgi:LuxR family maltose regulon positive regulatory protein
MMGTGGTASEAEGDVLHVSQRHEARFFVPVPSALFSASATVGDRLSEALGRVAVVCAPAGYGKTSQIAAWAASDPRPVAWVDLGRVDNDPVVLLAGLVQVLCEVTDFDAEAVPSSRRSPIEFCDVVVPSFGRLVASCRTPFVVALDDAHVIESPTALALLGALAGNVPPGSTVVIAGRSVPKTTLNRLRLDPGVVEITARDLALDVDDADAIFLSMGLALEPEHVTSLVRRTEGWPVGLRLAGLAVLGERDAATAVEAFTGQDRYVADYLRDEWVRGLSSEESEFLMQAACLGWFSGALCDEVFERCGSAKLLERLHENSLLVIPLDRRDEWFRMHHLLVDFLHDELRRTRADLVRDIHVRASSWFEAQNDIDSAFHHAIQAGDLSRGERLIVEHAGEYDTKGRHATVQAWLSSLPGHFVNTRPSLCVVAAVTALAVDGGVSCDRWMRFFEQAVESPDGAHADHVTLVKAALLRALIGRAPVADLSDDAELAYQELGPGTWHAMACLVLGALRYLQDEDSMATELLIEGAAEAKISGAATLEAICHAHLAIVLDRVGDNERATIVALAARESLRVNRIEGVSTTVLVTAMNALVVARKGDFDGARADVRSARRQLAGFDSVMPWLNVQTRLVLARTSLLLGDRMGARTLLDELEQHLRCQPDAIGSKKQLAELSDLVDSARRTLPCGAPALTAAELRVLHYLPTNLGLGDIAERLYVSRNTAKSHTAAIYRKLGTSSRREAVELARRAGLLPGVESDDLGSPIAERHVDYVTTW